MSNQPKHFNKTRIAPTPSGFLHVGNVLSFIITAVLARKHSAKILLRIDDLDRARVNQQYVQDIFDTLNFLEIPWDEGPQDVKDFEDNYSQLHRIPLYNEALQQLRDENKIYACTCSRSQLNAGDECLCMNKNIPLSTENASWRLITNAGTVLQVKNYNGEIIKSKLPGEMHNFVVRKKDGFPAYQLTSVVDDLFYGMDMIIRGEDLWPSTLAQQELAIILGKEKFSEITFFHHSLLMDGGNKLSKSAGATSICYLRENGKTPGDIFTLIATMLGIHEPITNWERLGELVSSQS
ncbi:MAG: glutamate--tRNA ligase family protein [Bacteroidota bacterium]|nr:glutamate--tRNA ligase family protein [Bacteroidota bacterium]